MPLIVYDRCESKTGKGWPGRENSKVENWVISGRVC